MMINLDDALELYAKTAIRKKNKSTIKSVSGRICALNNNGFIIMNHLHDAVNQKHKKDANKHVINPLHHLEYVMEKFEDFAKTKNYSENTLRSYRASVKSFSIFIIGQYKGNVSLLDDNSAAFQFCKLIAKHAIFCSIDVAEGVKKGRHGSKENKNVGNKYYSWCNCNTRRTKHNEKVGVVITENINGIGIIKVKLDTNQQASSAIKKAVILGDKIGMGNVSAYESYMACHIWDKTCYDCRFHTSVFNLVLIPEVIAGLSDYYDDVKKLLQYESAKRFGVYPEGEEEPKEPSFYNKLNDCWRQQEEHNRALKNHRFVELK